MTSTETNHWPGEVTLQLGDVVQLDGGPQIVEMVNDCRARCLPLSPKDRSFTPKLSDEQATIRSMGVGKSITIHLPKHLVLERRGEAGLKEFLDGKKKAAAGKVKLEPGHVVCYEGANLTVTSVDDEHAVGHEDSGAAHLLPRFVKSFYLAKDWEHATAAQLEQHLKELLEAHGQSLEVVEPKPETETINEAEIMAKKTKAVKKAAKAIISYAGRPKLIAQLIHDGKSDDQIIEEVNAKYPGSSKGSVLKTIASKRVKAGTFLEAK